MTQGQDPRLGVQFAVVRALAGSTALPEALAAVLAQAGRGMGWSVGVAWDLTEAGQLVATEVWQSSARAFARFAEATRAAAFVRGQGLPGTVWETGSPAWVTDAGADTTFIRHEPAALDGLRRGLAFPVLSGGTVLGVIEFFGTEAGEPDDGLLDLAAAIGAQLGQFVVRLRGAEALRGSEARATAVVESAFDCVVSVDAEGRIVEFNPAAERTFGYGRHQVVGRKLTEVLIPPDLREAHRNGFGRALSGGPGMVPGRRMETTAMRADGSLLPVELTVTRVDLQGGPLFTGFIRDLTERKRAEMEIAFLAHHDKLTGLPNRTLFEQVLDEALDRARQDALGVGVLSVDLNNFKLVNDSLGHAAGDALLQEIALRLSEVTRDSDVVARLGGDEFVLLLGDLPTPHAPGKGEASDHVLTAEGVAARVHEVLAAPFRLADSEFYVTASIGISVYPVDAKDAQALLRNADAAMYQSKRSGPGSSVVYSHHASDAGRLLSMATRLRRAVDRADWIVHYQPVVSLFDGRMVGVEALLRWVERDGSLVQPNDFIPLAEEMGLIEPIGKWVLDEVCRQARAWQDADIALDMSFNLSPRQLWQPELSRRVIGTVESSGVDPKRMIIEITESATMADPERTQHILWDLHRRGLRLALDDFGTGYSSLSRLKHLPVDILKIDRSFVHDLPGTREARSMVRAIIQLAHGLGMMPLAEGVETEAQWRFLAERGCPLGQGYQFGHPVPAEAIADAYVRGAVTVLDESSS